MISKKTNARSIHKCSSRYCSSFALRLISGSMLQMVAYVLAANHLLSSIKSNSTGLSPPLEMPPLTAADNSIYLLPNVAMTDSGPVRGKIIHMGLRQYTMFLGIPYAQPPLGPLRFREPKPAMPWTLQMEVGSEYGATCPQIPYDPTTMSEDCLYLNVFAPFTPSGDTARANYPVMVWIHGSGFVSGSSKQFDADSIIHNIVSKDVLFVTFNYRLGPLGFWTTKTDGAPGNYGILDQLMALTWVKNNIRNFGGNPDHVTIAGESSGAMSVSLLTLSPAAKDLFKQAIMMSGSAFAPQAVSDERTNSVDTSIELAEKLGCFPNKLEKVKNSAAAAATASKTAKTVNSEVMDNGPINETDISNASISSANGFTPINETLSFPYTKIHGTGFQEKMDFTRLKRSIFSISSPKLFGAFATFVKLLRHLPTETEEVSGGGHRTVFECMQEAPVKQLIETEVTPPWPYFAWSPRVDGKVLPKPVAELALTRQPINTLMGTTKDEFAFFSLPNPSLGWHKREMVVQHPIDIQQKSIPNFIVKEKYFNFEQIRSAVQYQYIDLPKAKCLGANVNTSGKFWFQKDIEMKSAMLFWVPSFSDAKNMLQRGGNTFLYSWDYISDNVFTNSEWRGAVHGSDVPFLLNQTHWPGTLPSVESLRDYRMREVLTTLWTNFVKYGNPTANAILGTYWKPLNLEEAHYLSIDLPRLEMKNGYHMEDVTFWNYLVTSLQESNGVCQKAKNMAGLPMFMYYALYC